MMRNLRPEEQLRGGNEPWESKFEGKFRLHEQELAYKAGWMDAVAMRAEIRYNIKSPCSICRRCGRKEAYSYSVRTYFSVKILRINPSVESQQKL